MKPRTSAFPAVAAASLSACIIIDADESGRDSFHVVTQSGLAHVQSVSIGRGGVTAAMPGACAAKQTAEADVDRDGRRAYEIGVGYPDHDV